MFSDIGIPGLILILVIALIVFGPNKLPQIGQAMGKSIKEFKDSMQGINKDKESESTDSKS
ncbi:twin-arginine translocase TatA/TatE family subunit [Effusibacillus dendaii]|uniref:Sec-independent protein translocase protein TatA n=1 Tax=Effusibacillus dendaii TaxID=2743772 RepID=A0A7I8DE36_9BACL|nr:twin-arginine translocase TatA/TatE family subunit [Effusibacillus dendaii]BCJ88374.1 hypothetical protein skT53_33590 [Effusibacillus dendaii]